MLTLLYNQTTPVVLKEFAFDVNSTSAIGNIPLKKTNAVGFSFAQTSASSFLVGRTRRVGTSWAQTETFTPILKRTRGYEFGFDQTGTYLFDNSQAGSKTFRFTAAQTQNFGLIPLTREVAASFSVAQEQTIQVGTYGDPISYYNGTNNSTLPPPYDVGDLLVAYAYNDGGNTAPTTAPGFITVGTRIGNTNGGTVGYRIAETTNDSLVGWAGASSVIIHVYKGAYGIGNFNTNSGTGQVIGYPTLALQQPGHSWVLAFSGHRTGNANGLTTAPSGSTFRIQSRDATDTVQSYDTNGPSTGWTSRTNSTSSTSSGWTSFTVEILQAVGSAGWGKIKQNAFAVDQTGTYMPALSMNRGFVLPVAQDTDSGANNLFLNRDVKMTYDQFLTYFFEFAGDIGIFFNVEQTQEISFHLQKEFLLSGFGWDQTSSYSFELLSDDTRELFIDVVQHQNFGFELSVKKRVDPVTFDVGLRFNRFEELGPYTVNLLDDVYRYQISRRKSTHVYEITDTPVSEVQIKPVLPPGVIEEYFDVPLDPEVWAISGAVDYHQDMLRLRLDQYEPTAGQFTSVGSSVTTVREFGFGEYEFEFRSGSTSVDWDTYGYPTSGGRSIVGSVGPNSVATTVYGLNDGLTFEARADTDQDYPDYESTSPLFGPYDRFTRVKVVWTPNSIEYWVNGELDTTNTYTVPNNPVQFSFAHLGDPNRLATPNTPRYMFVRYFRFTPAAVVADKSFRMRIAQTQTYGAVLDTRSMYRRFEFSVNAYQTYLAHQIRRNRKVEPVVDQVEEISAHITRKLALKVNVPQTQTFTPSLAFNRTLALVPIAQTETISPKLARTRRVTPATINQTTGTTVLLGRRREVVLPVTQATTAAINIVRQRANALGIGQVETITPKVSRVRSVKPAVAQTEVISPKLARTRRVAPATIAQTEVISPALIVAKYDPASQKSFLMEVKQTQTVRADVKRIRSLKPEVVQTWVMSAKLGRTKQIVINPWYQQEIITPVVSRIRPNKATVAQTSTVATGPLKRLRAVPFQIDQYISYNGETNSVKKTFALNVPQTSNIDVKFGRIKSFKMDVAQTEVFKVSTLSYLQTFAFTVAQTTTNVPRLRRIRSLKPAIAQTEVINPKLNRLKVFRAAPIAQTEVINPKLNRVKRLYAKVEQTEVFAFNLSTERNITETTTPWYDAGFASQLDRGAGASWTNLPNIYQVDGSYSQVVVPANSEAHGLYIGNFGLTVPTGSTIMGIEFRARYTVTAGTLGYDYSYIAQNGSFIPLSSVEGRQLVAGTDNYSYLGSTEDLWGGVDTNDNRLFDRNFAAADFNANFALFLQLSAGAAGATIRLDGVQVRVKYLTVATNPGTNPPVQPLPAIVVAVNVPFPEVAKLQPMPMPAQVVAVNVPFTPTTPPPTTPTALPVPLNTNTVAINVPATPL